MKRRCSKCGIEKELTGFHKNKDGRDGFDTRCKQCCSDYAKNYYQDHKEEVKAHVREWHRLKGSGKVLVTEKHCPRCDTVKDASGFDKDKSQLTGLRNWCKECRKVKWFDNRDENLEKKHICYQKHRPKILAYAHKYSQDNREVIAEKHKEYIKRPEVRLAINNNRKNRTATDPMFRLNNAMRGAIGHSLRGNKKGNKWELLAGYSLDQLKKHLEKQFLPGMTWENYGKNGWEVDHHIPLSAHHFMTAGDIDFKRAWNIKNLRPMWAPDNRSKRDKIEKPFQPALAIAV
jgi:hypothetical protein